MQWKFFKFFCCCFELELFAVVQWKNRTTIENQYEEYWLTYHLNLILPVHSEFCFAASILQFAKTEKNSNTKMCQAICDSDSMLSTKKLSTSSLNRLGSHTMETNTADDLYYTEINCALRETIPCDMNDSCDASSHKNCAPSQLHCTINRTNHNLPTCNTQQTSRLLPDGTSFTKRNRIITNISIPSKFCHPKQHKQPKFLRCHCN